jgi:hypothetical protein
MHIVELPIACSIMDLSTAFLEMRKSDRSAVVAREGGNFWLISATDIARGLKEGRGSLATLDDKISLYVFWPSTLLSYNVSLATPFETASKYELILDGVRQTYALLAAGIRYALVMTRHESDARPLESSPLGCYCTARPTCYGSGNFTGGNCSVGHMGTIYCVP